MSEKDPAAARFAAIHITRLMGVAFVVVGLLVATGRLLPGLPDWVGYLLLANGLVDIFVIPPILIRKWRTPK
ncbi:hypothetical protein [Novosphingobium mangrovi (ex Huang et al. 2023)]|uniref:Uncharacterized protein n=1 Tax=Novosphingobium mangrovi (ex Huang et al. 2023) TaxID=2976432 RepID=A0ABT2I4H0_9SPHN|nr:hypothetical protein [Novosphingobium mangrovi (ex Huang et al. 2023)]MCT2399697.1 hypothetical protein [Novosphingobium mangrovi (ex Huang et al. 2023)]